MDISIKDLQIIRNCLCVAEIGCNAGILPPCPETEALSGHTAEIHKVRKEIEARLSYIKTSLEL